MKSARSARGSMDASIAAFPPDVQAMLEQIRATNPKGHPEILARPATAARPDSQYRAISDQGKLGTIPNKGEGALALAQTRCVLSSSQETKWTTSSSRRCQR
jgi:hypothetical protein